MITKKTLRNRYYASIAVVCLVVISAVAVVGVKAFQSRSEASPQVVVEGDWLGNVQAPESSEVQEEESLGGSGIVNNNPFILNGEQFFTYTPTFKNATTTFVKVVTPFRTRYNATTTDFNYATSTIDMVSLDITGVATSSLNFVCGTDADGYGSPDGDLLLKSFYATSSVTLLQNNIATSTALGSFGGGSTAKVLLTQSYPYFICAAGAPYEAGQLGALTGLNNTFDGAATVRINRIIN